MKKALLFVLSVFLFATPCFAGDDDILARIEALEQQVADLQAQIDALSGISSNTTTDESSPAPGESITLEVGTWVVGDDIPAGKYNITCSNDAGAMIYVYKSLDDKLNDELFSDIYSVTSEAAKAAFADLYDDNPSADVLLDSMNTVVYNVYLIDGQCLKIDGSAATFTCP